MIRKSSFFLSLVAHLLLLALFIFSFHFQSWHERDKPPELYVPSYLYRGELNMVDPAQKRQDVTHKKEKKTAKNGIEKPEKKKARQQGNAQHTAQPRSPSAPPMPDQSTKSKVTEAVNLVGEKTVVKPLVEILGKALGACLKYPRMAMEFNITGTSYIGFVLHPNGMVTNVRVVKSSGAGVLDDAAMAGVRDMSPILNVAPYVPESRFLVIGIIFGGEQKTRA